MNSKTELISSIRLFRTSPHACSYKTDQIAATVFVDPELEIDQGLNSKLSELGYRRSGAHLYRPDCDNCNACISCRLPVQSFEQQRRHKRIWNKNKDLHVKEEVTLEDKNSFELYEKYINTRHRDGDMYPASIEQFEAFICSATSSTRFLSFFSNDSLVAVSVTDQLSQGLSAVYTFFDPSLNSRSLGSYVILWQIEEARRLKLPYVYLGYWIKDCKKMQYKSSFRPIELLIDGDWLLLR